MRFYSAEVLLALEYLHALGFIYRDLKPENILLHADGHVRLADFDLSKTSGKAIDARVVQNAMGMGSSGGAPQMVVEPNFVTNSFVGTEEYLAPEVIVGKGHSASVDWWTFGILMYEMLYGTTPFRGRTQNDTFRRIEAADVHFPNHPRCTVTKDCKSIIKKLLCADPRKRLGAYGGAAEIKAHPFWKNLKFQLIRNMPPPLQPKLNNALDLSAFPKFEDDDKNSDDEEVDAQDLDQQNPFKDFARVDRHEKHESNESDQPTRLGSSTSSLKASASIPKVDDAAWAALGMSVDGTKSPRISEHKVSHVSPTGKPSLSSSAFNHEKHHSDRPMDSLSHSMSIKKSHAEIHKSPSHPNLGELADHHGLGHSSSKSDLHRVSKHGEKRSGSPSSSTRDLLAKDKEAHKEKSKKRVKGSDSTESASDSSEDERARRPSHSAKSSKPSSRAPSRKNSRSPPRSRKNSRSPPRSRKSSRSPPKSRKSSRSPPKSRKSSRSPPRSRKNSRSPPRSRKSSRSPPKTKTSASHLSPATSRSRASRSHEDLAALAAKAEKHTHHHHHSRQTGSSKSSRHGSKRSRRDLKSDETASNSRSASISSDSEHSGSSS